MSPPALPEEDFCPLVECPEVLCAEGEIVGISRELITESLNSARDG